MQYVSNVVGLLTLEELNLELSYMELIDFTSEDFKSSNRLREALRNSEIVKYNPILHKTSKRLKVLKTLPPLTTEIKTIIPQVDSYIKESLKIISDRMNYIIERIDFLTTKSQETLNTAAYEKEVIVKYDNPKLDLLLDKIDRFIESGFICKKSDMDIKYTEKIKSDFEIPLFVPEISLDNYTQNKIITQEDQSEGTDNILEKLKELRK